MDLRCRLLASAEFRYIPSAMSLSAQLSRAAAVLLFACSMAVAQQPAHPIQRVAFIVSVAVDEYGKGVDPQGRIVSSEEYQEAVDFLAQAKVAAGRLPGDRAATAAILDSLIAAVAEKKPPSILIGLNQRFAASLGAEAALALPARALDIADGKKLYETNCASCHGTLGKGDGALAGTMNPPPPAIGTSAFMHAVAPGMAFRKISVGVSGTAMPAFESTLTTEQRWNIVTYLGSLRHPSDQVAQGEGLYFQGCVTCHGVTGAGDGTVSRSLSTLPPELGSLAWHAERSDSQLAVVVREGKLGTPMPPTSSLSPAQIQSVVAYLRTLPMRQSALAATTSASQDTTAAAAARRMISLLDQALNAARNQRTDDAMDRGMDAYLAFEPIESRARARSPGVVSSMERLFAEFRGGVSSGDIRGAERARDAIEAGMPRVIDLTRPAGSGGEAFIQSFLIILREGFEAILVVGAVVAFLLKTGHRERLRSIWIGVALALAASAVTAIGLRTILKAIPASQEIIEGVTMLIAVAVLFSVSYWLISRVEAAKWQQFIQGKVNSALDKGGGRALAFVAFLAVYREGAETALFYQALFNEGANIVMPISLGIVAGFAVLAVIFTGFYRFGVKIPMRKFFAVTSVLLYYMAFVFMGTGIRELQEGNAVSITLIRGLPTIDALGFFPTWETILAQLLLVVLFVFAVAKTFWPKRSVTLPTVPTEQAPAVASGVDALRGELDELRAENEQLRARLTSIESAIEEGVRR
jgi:high-affinity iron transporter